MAGLFALLLTLPTGVSPPVQDPCATPGACRHVEALSMERPDGRIVTLKVNKTLPWVTQGNIMIMPGDSVTVALDATEGKLVPRLVRSGAASEATPPGEGEIRFSFGAYSKGAVILKADSRYRDTLDYAAVMSTPSGGKRTSVCSLRRGVPVFESWRSPMHLLALSTFRPTSEPGCKTIETR